MITLVIQHGAKLVRVEPLHEPGREADARAEEPVAERERPLVGDHIDPLVEVETARRDDHDRRQYDLLRDEPADQDRRRDKLAEQRQEAERDATHREQKNEGRDDVSRVLRPSGGELLDARRERQKKREQDRARREREPEHHREDTISAFHACPSARDGAGLPGALNRPYRARR